MSRDERTERALRRARGDVRDAAVKGGDPVLEETVAQLAREAHALLRLNHAVADFAPEDPTALAACRVAALRYLESLPSGVGPEAALRRLRAAVWGWTPRTLSARARRSLDGRLRFWVGTVYGLRWRGARPRA